MLRQVFVALLLLSASLSAQSLASDPNRREAIAHYREGQDQLHREQWEKAIVAFDRAIKLDPLLTDAHYGRGEAFMGLRRYASAAQAFERTIDAARTLHGLAERSRVEVDRQIDDELRELREQLRRTQALKGGVAGFRTTQLEDRVRDLQRQRSSLGQPFEAPAGVLLALGSAHFRNGDRVQAEAFWSDAVRINSRLGEGWNNLAVIYMTSGRRKDAEDALRNAERGGFRVNPRLKDDVARLPQ
jgi:tetratricopeptide (TPR) repeat protein